MSDQKAFTLIEVMVALMVIVISLIAIIDSTSSSTWRASYLKEKTIANWVAQNQVSLYRAKKTWTGTSNLSGDVSMAGVEWEWKMHVSKTDDPLLRRIDVEVYLKGDDSIKASATGFTGKL
ncbi:MAG: type II secretion system minor pseudopilin GspI [Gammaproteobacteria bacterium]|nr:type II secretion system minor pseudopilin GspI [Gammaproteobacteria bacterium]